MTTCRQSPAHELQSIGFPRGTTDFFTVDLLDGTTAYVLAVIEHATHRRHRQRRHPRLTPMKFEALYTPAATPA